MSSWEDQMSEVRNRAKQVIKTVDMDRIIAIGHIASKTKISPVSLSIAHTSDTRDEEHRDWVIAHVPDLLALATFAWYELMTKETQP